MPGSAATSRSGDFEALMGEEIEFHVHHSHRAPWLRAFVLGKLLGAFATAFPAPSHNDFQRAAAIVNMKMNHVN